MTPLAQAVVVVCVVLLTAALVSTLRALRKTAARAENVLHLVEREIRPLASEVESLASEMRTLAQHANENMDRVSRVIDRVEDISLKAARLAGIVGSLTRVGQVAGVVGGVRKGLDVFVRRLKHR